MREKSEKVCVYTDEAHEKLTKTQIEAARRSLQELVSMWLDLRLGPVQDVYQLLMQPKKAYDLAVNKLVPEPLPVGPFTVKKSLDNLQLPDPTALYGFSSKIRQQVYCVSEELWSVDVDGKVVIDEREAASLIASQSIYTASPAGISLAQDLQKLCDLMNSINERCGGQLLDGDVWLHRWSLNKFKVRQESANGPWLISPDPDFLKQWLSKV
jgi:hypothetical protein